MATGKKGFVLYADLIYTVSKLPSDKAGDLFKHILSYVNDENPITDDILIQIAFEPIKQQLKRDLDKWEQEKETKSKSGQLGNLKRWHNDIYKKVIDEKITLKEGIKLSQSVAKDRTPIKEVAEIAVKDKVKENVKVIEININNQFEFFWTQYHSITKIPKTDKVPAFSYFKKLTLDERRKAYTMIQGYSDSNKDKQYIKKARTYLSDKCFNDEFKALENSKIYRKNEQ